MPPDLAVSLGPLTLRNPVICGAGEHVSSLEQIRAAVDAGAAAVVAKSANESEAARRQADGTDWVFVDEHRRVIHPSSAGQASMLNRSGLVQRPWDEWLELLAAADAHAAERGSWVIASIIPGDTAQLGRLAAEVEAAGIRWLELNLSAPHSGEAVEGAAIERPAEPARAAELTAIARAATSLPLSVKLAVEHHDVTGLAGAVSDAGADVVVMCGRHMGFLADPETQAPALGSFGGYSGPWALPLVSRWVAKTRQTLGAELPLVATNGARDGLDVARFMLAGASAVQVASSVIVEGPEAITRIADQLAVYLDEQQTSAADLIGRAADAAMTYEEAAVRRVG